MLGGTHMQNELATQTPQPEQTEQTTCCIVGSGPAGAVLALLLARQGIPVLLLEEHMDFDRDFRGDTVHPWVMVIMDQLGLSDRLLAIEHTQIDALPVQTAGGTVTLADFHHLRTKFPYIAMIPQVHFLEFVTGEAKRCPNFRLVMGARVEKLIIEDGYVHGVHYRGRDGWHEVRAVLTVAADGRFSRVRKLAGFHPVTTSAPIELLWFRLPRAPGEPEGTGVVSPRFGKGHFLLLIDRADHWQVGYFFPAGK